MNKTHKYLDRDVYDKPVLTKHVHFAATNPSVLVH